MSVSHNEDIRKIHLELKLPLSVDLWEVSIVRKTVIKRQTIDQSKHSDYFIVNNNCDYSSKHKNTSKSSSINSFFRETDVLKKDPPSVKNRKRIPPFFGPQSERGSEGEPDNKVSTSFRLGNSILKHLIKIPKKFVCSSFETNAINLETSFSLDCLPLGTPTLFINITLSFDHFAWKEVFYTTFKPIRSWLKAEAKFQFKNILLRP